MQEEQQSEQSTVTTAQLDDAIKRLTAKQLVCDQHEETLKSHKAERDTIEDELLELLEKANKTSYLLEGVARVNRLSKLSVTIPKDSMEKAKFFKWLNKKYGAEGFLAYVTVNSATLNKLYNDEFSNCPDEEKALFKIDGIDAPSERITLRVTANKK